MGWKYFESGDAYRDALWETGDYVSVGYPVALWSDVYMRWSVFHQRDEDAWKFDPLHSLDDAWQVAEKMKEVNWHTFCINLDYVFTRHKWDWSEDKPYITWFEKFVASLSAEGICIAALRTVGLEVNI
jgi:hypothetical protein